MGSNLVIWSTGFNEHRIKDRDDYERHRNYIMNNPLRAGLSAEITTYPYSPTTANISLDPAPPGLKPVEIEATVSPG
jgi:putative transposase